MNPLLVAYDGSPTAQAALAWATLLAAGGPVRLVRAVPGEPVAGARASAVAVHEHEAELAPLVAKLPPGSSMEVLPGTAASALSASAGRTGGWIVVGSRGRSPIAERLLGSNSREVLSHARVPALVVHEPPGTIERVVAAVDEGSRSRLVAREARLLAERLNVPLVLLHVLAMDPAVVANPGLFGITTQVWEDALRACGERVLGSLAGIAPPGTQTLVRAGDRAEVLLHEVGRHDVLAIGRRGSSGVDVAEWGSLAFRAASRGSFATLVV